eukprot:1204573-Pleurochrysis_carterae.AAC.1
MTLCNKKTITLHVGDHEQRFAAATKLADDMAWELVRPILKYIHSQCFNVDDSTKVLVDRRPSKPFATNRPYG